MNTNVKNVKTIQCVAELIIMVSEQNVLRVDVNLGKVPVNKAMRRPVVVPLGLIVKSSPLLRICSVWKANVVLA